MGTSYRMTIFYHHFPLTKYTPKNIMFALSVLWRWKVQIEVGLFYITSINLSECE